MANLAIKENDARNLYTSTGESVFAYTFPVKTTDDIRVSVNQVDLTYATDFTFTGLGDASGGDVTITAGTTSGDAVAIWLDLPIKRETGFTEGAAVLTAEALNNEMVERTRVDQMLCSEVRRTIRLEPDDITAGSNMVLGANDASQFQYIGRDAGGAIAYATEAIDTTVPLTSALIGSYLYPQSADEISLGITPTVYTYPTGHVMRYGAAGDGVTDDTTALNNAILVAASQGTPLYLASGTYVYTVGTATDISGIPEIIGEGAIIDCSASTSTVIFDANGAKDEIASSESFTFGDSTLDITGVAAEDRPDVGQTVLVTSIEAHPQTARSTYFKGTRTYCDSIVGDELRIYPEIDFDYTASAYVWVITENVVNMRGFKMIGNKSVSQAGIVLTLCRARIDVDLDYFPQACVRFESSSGSYSGTIRYPYIINGGNNYGVAVTDLSAVEIVRANITGTRHAVTVGGGTWLQTDSGGASGQAAYPATCTVSGGHYGSSRSGAAYATDPSLEIGAIDCHGIAKSLVVTGAVIYGGTKLAGIESCLISGCTIYHRNWSAFELVDSDTFDWGNIKLENNTVIFSGVPDATVVANWDNVPRFVHADTAVYVKRVEASNNTWLIEENFTADMRLGFTRGIDQLIFEGNTVSANLSAVSVYVWMEFWARSVLSLKGNTFKRVEMRLIPSNLAPTASTVFDHTVSDNEVIESGGAGIRMALNPLASQLDEFKTITINGNKAKRCQFSGINIRGDICTTAILQNNETIDCNEAGSATGYLQCGIGIQEVAATDPLNLLVLSGNVAISTSDATTAHVRGIYVETGATTNTDVYAKDNVSHGHSTEAMSDLEVTGQTVKQQQGNTEVTDHIEASDGALYKYSGSGWGAA